METEKVIKKRRKNWRTDTGRGRERDRERIFSFPAKRRSPSVIKTKKRDREIKRQEGEGHIARNSERRGGERERDRGSIFSFPAIRRKPLRHKNVPIQTAIQDIFQKLLPSTVLIFDGISDHDAHVRK